MTRITVRIDIFFHAAEVVRKFLTDRNPFFMFLDRHLSAFGNLLDSLADRLFLFRSHFRQVKVQLELVGVIRNTPLLGHGTPHLALQIKKFLFKLGNLVFLGPQSPVALLDGLVFFSRSGFVVGLHPFDVRQFLQLPSRFHRPPELGVTVAEQLLDEGFPVGGF